MIHLHKIKLQLDKFSSGVVTGVYPDHTYLVQGLGKRRLDKRPYKVVLCLFRAIKFNEFQSFQQQTKNLLQSQQLAQVDCSW